MPTVSSPEFTTASWPFEHEPALAEPDDELASPLSSSSPPHAATKSAASARSMSTARPVRMRGMASPPGQFTREREQDTTPFLSENGAWT